MIDTNEELPGLLGEIEEVAGRKVALLIGENFGGVQVTFIRKAESDYWLTGLVGIETASLICDYFAVRGGGSNYSNLKGSVYRETVPLLGTGRMARVREELHRDALIALQAGKGARSVAKELRVHERTVFRWRAQFRREKLL